LARERLQKILARAGFGSRRHCEELISSGRVTVGGLIVAELGTRADPNARDIAVDGRPARIESIVAYLVNKPRGYVCTSSEVQADLRAVDLVDDKRRLYVAGRLDAESQGLLIMTNDGELTQLLTHPSHRVEKEYRVEVTDRVSAGAVEKLRQGVRLAEGLARAKSVKKVKRGLKVILTGGMNRQIRRMLGKVGLKVRRLERIRIAFLKLGALKPGESRELTAKEVAKLKRSCLEGPPPPARKPRRPADPKKRGRPGSPKKGGKAAPKERGRPGSPKKGGKAAPKKRGRPGSPKKGGRAAPKKRGRPGSPKKPGKAPAKKRRAK